MVSTPELPNVWLFSGVSFKRAFKMQLTRVDLCKLDLQQGRGSIGFAPNRQQTWSSKLIYHPLHPHQQHQHHKEHHLQWQSGKIVLHLPIIGVLGYFRDAVIYIGSIPAYLPCSSSTSATPTTRRVSSTMAIKSKSITNDFKPGSRFENVAKNLGP